MPSMDKNNRGSRTRHRSNSGSAPKSRHRRPVMNVKLTRPVYTESEFQKGYKHIENNQQPHVQIQEKVRRMRCSLRLQDVQRFILKLVPIISWLPRYDVRRDLLGDVIAGATIGVMRIPQAMAYAILATLPAVYGLYMAFFPVLVYVVLGTSRHISIGTFALVSIMTGNAIDNFLQDKESGDTPTEMPMLEVTNKPNSASHDMERIQVATVLCTLVGIIQLVMGILRLGFVTIYLSEPLVRGFTTGAAIHVFTSQFKSLFGISVPRLSGPLSIVWTYTHFFSHLASTNTTTLIISIMSISILMVSSEILDYHANRGLCTRNTAPLEDGQQAAPRMPRKKLPIPTELLVIIIATAASYSLKFNTTYGVEVVGIIPTGLPPPVVPQFSFIVKLIPDAIAIAIVAFAISVSMASLMANRNNYEVDSNQELLAYGSCNLLSSFFSCFPQSASLSRSVVQESSGGKTQIAGVVSAVLVLIVLLFLGHLFTQLPVACLASVIVVALRGLFRQFKDILLLWKISYIDLSIWMVSCVAVVLLNVDLGLLVAVLFSLATVIVRTQKPDCVLMGKIPGTDIYRDIATIEALTITEWMVDAIQWVGAAGKTTAPGSFCPGHFLFNRLSSVYKAEELPGIKIFRASSSLCFINVEHFKSSLYSKVGIDPQKELNKAGTRHGCMCLPGKPKDTNTNGVELPHTAPGNSTTEPPLAVNKVHTVIIDCSMFSFIDLVGIKMLQTIVADYKKIGIGVMFANCKAPIRQSMLQSSRLGIDRSIDLRHMYISVHDAVLHFYTPNNSPTKCNKSTSSMYDFDPTALAAANQTLTPATISATLHLQGLDVPQHERRYSTTTIQTDLGDDHNDTHQVEMHNCHGNSHYDNEGFVKWVHDIGGEIGLNASSDDTKL